MKDILDFLKESLGLDEDEKKTEETTDTIIIPEHPLYEIILMRVKDLGDIDDALSQIADEKNPVILDLGHLKMKSLDDFKMAAEKIKNLKEDLGAEVILLSASEKDVVIITPPEIKLIRKE